MCVCKIHGKIKHVPNHQPPKHDQSLVGMYVIWQKSALFQFISHYAAQQVGGPVTPRL